MTSRSLICSKRQVGQPVLAASRLSSRLVFTVTKESRHESRLAGKTACPTKQHSRNQIEASPGCEPAFWPACLHHKKSRQDCRPHKSLRRKQKLMGSRTLILLLYCSGLLTAGTVSGRVEIVSSKDPDVRKHFDYSGVVIWLEPVSGAATVTVAGRRAEMVQKEKRFTPHVLPIAVGTTIDFPNYDPIFHNAFSNYNGQIFDVGLYPPGSTRSILFRRPGVVRVFCNIHPTMSAVIVVLKSPYFALSGRTGAFSIPNIPAGTYRLRVFH